MRAEAGGGSRVAHAGGGRAVGVGWRTQAEAGGGGGAAHAGGGRAAGQQTAGPRDAAVV
jgi:hypothetical protein